MPFSPIDSQIFKYQFSDPELATLFTDERYVAYLVEVEVALAVAQAKLGVIPQTACDAIVAASKTFAVNFERLATITEKTGVPTIDLVAQLRAHVGGEAASFVHWGATTQDIMDTALVLQLRAAIELIEGRLTAVINNLATLADQHRQTLMAGRTHSQQALPVPFGLKAAGWLAPLLRHRERLAELKSRLFVVQFGGAAGTLASLGDEGLAVQAGLAAELGLGVPLMPWHTQRDAVAEFAGWLSLVSGSLAKMGQDLILLAQSEIGEIRETADLSRGGSSTMPQKSNPIISELIIAAARTNASLLASMHQAMVQEQERATHGWQVEWLSLPQMVMLTTVALNKAAFLSQNLLVKKERMAANVAAANGLMLAEAISFALTETMGRTEAKKVVREAVQIALAENRHLADVVRENTGANLDWKRLKDEKAYFGVAEQFIERVLAAVDDKA
ncbi:MAG: 3-carboxy-cis,cis-muconate cycloisomerase [Chloroflexota bacterium]